ncbi:MAG: hypothetical protein E7218_02185 [Anaerofustis stercorihominis]|nr:hypothetical protein [Anaerofustis stercorihominis]
MTLKKLSAILLVLLLTLGLFSCGDDTSDIPVLEVTDKTSSELAYVTDDTIKAGFPADEWTGFDYTLPLTVMYTQTMNTQGGAVNINIQNLTAFPKKLDEAALESFRGSIEQNIGFAEISVFELRRLNDENVIYIELVTVINDELIDQAIKNGLFTEAEIDALGGREVLKQTPPTNQIALYAVVDNRLCMYTGTYYEDSQKQAVLDVINVMVQTTEVFE